MSDDQQKPPELANDQTQTPPTPDQVNPAGTGRGKAGEKPSFFKAQSIKVLRGSIGLLEGIVARLEAESVNQLPSKATPMVTKLESPPVLDTPTVPPELEGVSRTEETIVPVPEIVSPSPELTTQNLAGKPASQPTQPELLDRILPSFPRLEAFWDATLVKIRSVLPAAWNEKLSDWGLTGAIASIVVILLLTTVALLPKTPTQVAKAPPNTIEAPPELKAPEEPQPVEPAPLPTPDLTPEQSLIAAIQTQVAEITDRYGNGLIQSIEANFLGSRLVVKVSEGWYDLKASEQNKLANEVLQRSNELDFSKLEITDLEGTVLARSPVVGSNMVILKRLANG